MTAPPDNGDPYVEARYRDLLFLHAQSPEFADVDLTRMPEFADLSVAECLRNVAEAPGEQIPVSARLAVLYDLAKAGTQQGFVADDYRRLVSSTLALKPGNTLLPPDALIEDLAQSAAADAPFNTTRSAESFEHAETAFIGRRICNIQRVVVGGIRATWIYSEFETDAPFAAVAEWLDPRRGALGPMFFRRMDLIWPTGARSAGRPRTATSTGRGSSTRRCSCAAVEHAAALHLLAEAPRPRHDLRPGPQPGQGDRRRPGVPARDRRRGEAQGAGAQDRRLHAGPVGRRRRPGLPVLDGLDPRRGTGRDGDHADGADPDPGHEQHPCAATVEDWV